MEGKELNDEKTDLHEVELFLKNKATCCTEENIGQVLSTNYVIVERILNWLAGLDLNSCAQVSTHSDDDDDIMDAHINSADHKQVYACVSNSEVGAHFHSILKEASAEPKLGLIFCNDRFFFKPHHYFVDFNVRSTHRHRKKKKPEKKEESKVHQSQRMKYNKPVMNFLAKNFPPSCYLLGCAVPGIVGTPVNYSAPVEAETCPGFSGVFLPDIPGVYVHPFTVTEDEQFLASFDKRSKNQVPMKDVSQIIGISNDTEVKCLLLFVREVLEDKSPVHTLIEHYLVKQERNIAIGGAVVPELGFPYSVKNKSRVIAGGVAFSGENVLAASVLIEEHVNSISDLEAKLRKLKTCSIPEKKCVAFMFACCGRGTFFYQRSNVEAEIFHKVFPKVPLFGLFGNGELGINYFPKKTSKKRNINSTPTGVSGISWLHTYTTVFVLLSFEN
ncbi:F-box only protein 22-like isoform X2 [Limulus polyphemus]|uniref:F-box only protein 22-like isoform X2 n=1 Tax=Limulus polyphemus TaxID=6850 RepID=A0ABM1BVM2_LIMPO|nr:F-box only protein 22-like isoform X2 [Limulus polyphemus]